ncbi:hypothetical protein A9Q81_27550 [Gammaproteobacteria bacterium 42_54_T18]|nr:hypothetical protein A9Q81_27550 [Gammaproteobacteria bacterium 42_54_T18]
MKVGVDVIAKEPSPFTLGVLATKYGMWCQGHGPFSWYRVNDEQEIWFWWKKSVNEVSQADDFNEYEILAATINDSGNDNEQRIVWPEKFVGSSIERLTKNEYEK